MRQKIHLILFLFFVTASFSQPITVNTTTYTVPQLVTDVLFGNGTAGSACVGTISNITWSTGTNFGTAFNGIGYFQNTNPSFPMNNGVILSTGNVAAAPGPNTTTQSNGVNAWLGDTQLFSYIQGLGIDGGLNIYRNATVLEFDFTPLTNQMSFDFLFASEEYGTFQCTFSDSFAFFLTNTTLGSPPVNLALIPNTTTPISVVTIRDFTNNASCASANPSFFGNFNGGGNAAAAATNFNGETIKMTASSAVIPGNIYRIKLVIADRNDNSFDSAVFLGGGSFNVGTLELAGVGYESFTDLTIADGTAVCGSTPLVIQAGAVAIPGVTYQWTYNSAPIAGATTNSYTVTQSGQYGITITYPGGCQQSDSMIAEFYPQLPLGTPSTLAQCSAPFNLTQNQAAILNGQNNPISYYTTLAQAQTITNRILTPTNYNGTNGQQIFVAVEDSNTGCITTTSFFLQINPLLCSPPNATTPPNLTVCETSTGLGVFNFTPQTPVVLGANNATTHVVSYHLSQAAADANTNAITPINNFSGSNGQIIYVRLQNSTTPSLYDTVSFTLTVIPLPAATISGTTAVCENAASPVITFTGANSTPPYTFTYIDPSGATVDITTIAGNSITIPVSTVSAGTFSYQLLSVSSVTTPVCSQPQTGTATVTVNPVPTATISGTQAVCLNASPSPQIVFTGTNGVAPYTFSYTLNTVAQPPVTTTSGNTFVINQPTTTAGTFDYVLTGVSSASTPACAQPQTGTATVVVNPLPSATISGTTTVCQGAASQNITFTGSGSTAPYTFTYINPSGATVDITTTSGNSITIPVSTATAGTFAYQLLSVSSATTPVCSQPQTGTATVTVNPMPTATISGTQSVCLNATAPQIVFTGTNGVAPYTFSYTLNSVAQPPVTTTSGNTFVINQSTATAGTFDYVLTGVSSASTPACAQPQTGTATVVVNPLPSATISGTTTVCQVAASQNITFTGSGSTAPYTFTYINPSGATVDITTTSGNSITIPVSAASPGTFSYQLVSVSSATTPVCSQPQTGTATVTVNPMPTATISGTQAVCLNASPSPQIVFTGTNGVAPYTFSYTLNTVAQPPVTTTSGNTFVINQPTTTAGTFDYVLTGVSSASTPACAQPQNGTATITVNTAPIINTPTAYQICDDNNDGDSCLFDLTTKNAEISTDPNVIISYHETPDAAAVGGTPIDTATPYCNNGVTTLYIRATFIGSTTCYSTTTLQLIVNPRPIPNPVITDYALCDVTNPGDDQEVFTLNTKTTEIANGQTGVTVSYYESQADALAQSNPLPNSYTNTSTPQQIWINIRNNTSGCNSVASFNLVVNPLPTAVAPLPIVQCSNGSVTTATFDLTVNEAVVTAGETGVVVTYYNSLADAQAPTAAIVTPTTYLGNDNEIIYIRVENTATGCFSTTSQLLRVTEGPVANTPLPLEYCDPNNDGFGVFDLNSAINAIVGGSLPPGVTVSFHETETDALLGANPLTSPYANINVNTQTIYVKVFYTTTGCANYVALQLIVNPTPEATEPDDLHLCDDNGLVGFEAFNLTTVIPQVLGSIDPTTHTVTFYNNLPAAQAGTGNITNILSYTNSTINQETIYVRVETTATGCFDIVMFDIIVDPLPLSTQPNYPQYSLCDDDQSQIGFEVFDLLSREEAILLGQTGMSVTFYPSLTDAQDNTNAITNLNYQNTAIYVQTLGIRITNVTTGCYVVSTMDIRVNPLPTPIPPTDPLTVCDSDQDGFAPFDLSLLLPGLLQGANYTITFHETLGNAQTGADALPLNYDNINPFVQILYVRAVDPETGCVGFTTVELNVNPSPLPVSATALPNLQRCDTDNNNQNGSTAVNLTVQTPLVLAGQPATGTYTVTYYTSQALATAGNFAIGNPTTYVASNNQTIWVRVENTVTGCFQVSSFQVIIGIPLVVPTPAPISVCDNDDQPNNLFTAFDLTVRQITALPGYTIAYYPSLSNAQAGINQITNPTNFINTTATVQTLGVSITSAQGCVSYTSLTIRVLPIPTPRTDPPTLLPLCENTTGSGQATVNLATNAAFIANGNPNVVLHYFPTLADLESNTNEILTPTAAVVGDPALAGTTIGLVQFAYIAVSSNQYFDYTNRACYKVVAQGYIINPLPVVDIVGTANSYQICEADVTGVNDGFEIFDLTSLTADLLEGNMTVPASTYSVAFYAGAGATNPIAAPSAYTNTTNPQTIYVVITNTITGCTSDVGNFEIRVNPKPSITPLAPFETCDNVDGVNDGMALYQNNSLGLADYIDEILGTTQLPADYTVTFYTSQADAIAGLPATAIQDLVNYQVMTGTYWIRVTNNVTGCYQTSSFDVIVEQIAEPFITSNTGSNIACVDFPGTAVNNNLILDSNVSNTGYTFEWYAAGVLIANENSATLAITEMDADQIVYSVIAISTSPLACPSEEVTFTVIRSGQATNATYTVSNAFSEMQTITVTNDGYGIYHYSLDDGPILDNGGIFTNVTLGVHTIYIWDVRDPDGYSCGVTTITGVQIIDYPHYFTPNGDGIHDSWNIVGLGEQPNAKIYIFDRHGKLLKQISSTSAGWDGTYNGHLMPGDDYWFTVDYIEQAQNKQFRAHFALKR